MSEIKPSLEKDSARIWRMGGSEERTSNSTKAWSNIWQCINSELVVSCQISLKRREAKSLYVGVKNKPEASKASELKGAEEDMEGTLYFFLFFFFRQMQPQDLTPTKSLLCVVDHTDGWQHLSGRRSPLNHHNGSRSGTLGGAEWNWATRRANAHSQLWGGLKWPFFKRKNMYVYKRDCYTGITVQV